MNRRFALLGLALVPLLSDAPVRAGGPPPTNDARVPAIVGRHLKAMAALPSFAADVTVEEAGAKPGAPALSARLQFARPNRYKLTVSEGGKVVETIVSDGTTLRQWTDKHVAEEAAPAALNALLPSLPRATASLWPLAILTMPELLPTLRDLQEDTGEAIGGVAAKRFRGKFNYRDDPGHLAVWVDEASGRPLRIAFSHGKQKLTLHLREVTAAATFEERPPTGLAPLPRDPEFPAIELGAPAPAFSLQTLDGKRVSLADGKGQVTLLEFWAPWCPGCRWAAPTVNKVVSELRPKGVRAILVSTTAERWQLEDYLQERTVAGPTVHDPAEQDDAVGYAKYKITGFPSFVVVDRQGRVAGVWKHYQEGLFEVRMRAALNRALAPASASGRAPAHGRRAALP
jgi:thiol-disulfide isomerase/thioredoxin/outer membrane lipoprotein-sorting protein